MGPYDPVASSGRVAVAHRLQLRSQNLFFSVECVIVNIVFPWIFDPNIHLNHLRRKRERKHRDHSNRLGSEVLQANKVESGRSRRMCQDVPG